jgi:iron complex transport system ATP-binding protein
LAGGEHALAVQPVIVTANGIALAGRLQPTDVILRSGELTCLIGPNGSGKTSLLHALAGIGRPVGEVRIDGEDPKHAPPARRRALLAYLPASRDLAWPLRVRDLVALGVQGASERHAVDDAIALLGLGGVAQRRADRLSTGERSRALIARVLASGAKLLLLDEPTANLDPRWQLTLMEHLLRLARQDGHAILAAVHDLDIAGRFADRLLLMHAGAIRAEGTPEALLAGDAVSEVFGIERGDAGWRVVR